MGQANTSLVTLSFSKDLVPSANGRLLAEIKNPAHESGEWPDRKMRYPLADGVHIVVGISNIHFEKTGEGQAVAPALQLDVDSLKDASIAIKKPIRVNTEIEGLPLKIHVPVDNAMANDLGMNAYGSLMLKAYHPHVSNAAVEIAPSANATIDLTKNGAQLPIASNGKKMSVGEALLGAMASPPGPERETALAATQQNMQMAVCMSKFGATAASCSVAPDARGPQGQQLGR